MFTNNKFASLLILSAMIFFTTPGIANNFSAQASPYNKNERKKTEDKSGRENTNHVADENDDSYVGKAKKVIKKGVSHINAVVSSGYEKVKSYVFRSILGWIIPKIIEKELKEIEKEEEGEGNSL
jgi:hypothetical protein